MTAAPVLLVLFLVLARLEARRVERTDEWQRFILEEKLRRALPAIRKVARQLEVQFLKLAAALKPVAASLAELKEIYE